MQTVAVLALTVRKCSPVAAQSWCSSGCQPGSGCHLVSAVPLDLDAVLIPLTCDIGMMLPLSVNVALLHIQLIPFNIEKAWLLKPKATHRSNLMDVTSPLEVLDLPAGWQQHGAQERPGGAAGCLAAPQAERAHGF